MMTSRRSKRLIVAEWRSFIDFIVDGRISDIRYGRGDIGFVQKPANRNN